MLLGGGMTASTCGILRLILKPWTRLGSGINLDHFNRRFRDFWPALYEVPRDW